MDEQTDLSLYDAVRTQLRSARLRRKLRNFGVDPEDAAHDVFCFLVKYPRKAKIQNMNGYVARWLSRLVDRVIDRSAKHRRCESQRVNHAQTLLAGLEARWGTR